MLTDLLGRRGINPIDAKVDERSLAEFRKKYTETDGECEPCTTIQNFICDVVTCTPKSTWNKSAGRVFARHVVVDVLHRSDNEENIDEVAEVFYTRLKTLRQQRSTLRQTPQQIAHAASMERRDQRKYQVWRICLRFLIFF